MKNRLIKVLVIVIVNEMSSVRIINTSPAGLFVDRIVCNGPNTIGTAFCNDGSIEVTDALSGDAEGDGEVDIADALLVAQYYMELINSFSC